MSINKPEPINKPLVGIIGLVCLISSAICYVFFYEQTSARSAFLRIGIVMTALFLALPRAGENVRWERLAPVIAGAVILIALAKKMFLVILPLLLIIGVLLTFFRSKPKERPPKGK